MRMITVILSALFASGATYANDNALGREFYDSLVQCSAFHSVESGSTGEGIDSVSSHLAAAGDYRADARKHAPDGKAETADKDILAAVQLYRQMISKGDAEDMAKGWTSLESACRELHKVKAQLSAKAGQEQTR